MRCKSSAALAALVLCFGSWNAQAQSYTPPYQQQIKSAQSVGVLGKDLAGDSTNFYTGSTSFSNVDLSVPGNNSLPVAVGRSFDIGADRNLAQHSSGGLWPQPVDSPKLFAFGDWELDIPYLSGTYTQQHGWQTDSTTPLNRCSVIGQVNAQGLPANAQPRRQTNKPSYLDFWYGNTLHVPGEDQAMLIASAPNANRPSTGGPYHWTTNKNWWISCLPSVVNGAGEGFLAIAPDGTKYWFNHISRRNSAAPYDTREEGGPGGGAPYREYYTWTQDVFLLPTRVEDRFGNWVTYDYSDDAFARLEAINASDGRQIVLSYNAQGFVDTVNDGTRTIRYFYTGTSLTEVRMPDDSSWRYSFAGVHISNQAPPPLESDPCNFIENHSNYNCMGWPQVSGSSTAYVIHPSGARVDFVFKFSPFQGGYTFGIAEKNITGPGLQPQKWYYAFSPTLEETKAQCRAGACPTRVWTDEISPEYRITRRMFGLKEHEDQGILLQVLRGYLPTSTTTIVTQPPVYRIPNSRRGLDDDIVDDATPVVLTNTTTTVIGPPQFFEEIDYFYRIGTPVGTSTGGGESFWSVRRTPVSKRQTHLQNAIFTYQANTWDSLDRATSVSRFSSITPDVVKNETTEYHDDTARWIMGQVKRSTTNGIETARTEFDGNSLPWKTYSFGKLQQTLGYTLTAGSQAGTLNTVTDGRTLTTTLSQWHRGIPKLIQHADARTQSATVNDVGWVTSVTDENGYVTGYGYDTVGRLASIVHPTGDSTTWNATTMTFAPSIGAAYGLPAGHWRQTTSTGNARTITFLDAMWRPVVKETYDAANITGTLTQTVTRYDSEGQAIFSSYPQRNLNSTVYNTWADPGQTANALGVYTRYDALNRAVQTQQDSEQGLLTTTTEYLENFSTRVTNPKGVQTFTSYQVYDRPSLDQPNGIIHAMGLAEASHTDIYRDIFGKPTQLRRRNGNASVDSRRYYVYDANQQLCKTIEPETGSTVMAYDAASNVSWSAAGQALPSTTSCDHASVPAAAQVHRTYDARNRLKTLRFPDTRGDQDWEYTADGLPWKISTRNVTTPGASHPTNLYAYNKRRMLTTETLALPAWYTWSIGYAYDANGSLASQTYPSGQTVSYAPNALGQATQVVDSGTQLAGSGTTYAGNVSYHPNGGIAGFTYGNGIVHTMTPNARQLPGRSTDSGGALDHEYSYDPTGNVTYIGDHVQGSSHSRWMQYDALDRLTDAGSAAFGGDHWHRFTYDALDNLTSWKLAGVKDYANYYYEPGSQRLTNIQNTAGASVVGLGYDVRGNVTNKDGMLFDFDVGNRLRETTQAGVVLERYRYDAAGRRILANRMSGPVGSTGVVLSQYAQNGQLLYQSSDRTATTTDHIYLGGSLIAQREAPRNGGSATIKYQHTDALGSPVAVTNSAGAVIERMAYEPFGKVIGTAPKDGPGYTGHVLDAATGMNYAQQRYYDPMIGRFLSVDPVSANANTGAMFNRYNYAANNPYRYTDPDGRVPRGSLNLCSNGCSMFDGGIGPPSMREGDNEPRSTSNSGSSRASATAATAIGVARPAAGTAAPGMGLGAFIRVLLGRAIITAPLVIGGDSRQMFRYLHYGYAADAAKFGGGLRPGSYATTGPLMTGSLAQQALALPHQSAPDSYYSVQVTSSVPVIGPRPVQPTLVPPRSGGGVEYIFPNGTPPGSVTGPYPLPPED